MFRNFLISAFIFSLFISLNAGEIHDAVKRGNINRVKELLSEDPGLLNSKDQKGFTPLHTAVTAGKPDILMYLIEKGADLNLKNKNGLSPLFTALDRGKNNIAVVLIEHGADVNIKGYGGSTLLHMAARGGSKELARMLIDKGININETDRSGNTALHNVFETNSLSRERIELVKMMIGKGADINAKNREGGTPLIIALQKRFSEAAEYMIENNNTFAALPDGKSVLHWAASAGKNDIIEKLLENGVDVNEKTPDGNTALYYARKYGNIKTADILLKYSAEPVNVNELPGLKKDVNINEAVIWHTGHSGWVVKTKDHILVFDYAYGLWEKEKGEGKEFLSDGYLDPGFIKDLDTYVFVTHFHYDHYDKEILNWGKTVKNINYIFGWNVGNAPGYHCLEPRERKSIGDVEVITMNAEHPGVGFLVRVDGLVLYHSGDHGMDRSRLGKRYTDEIDYLAGQISKIDIAFVPVVFEKGVLYTVEKLSPNVLFPMHKWGNEYIYADFMQRNSGKYLNTRIISAEFRGQRFFYDDGAVK